MLASAPGSVNPRPVIRFGPAGWSYADWRGRVYPRRPPPGWRPLDLLGGLFDVVEVNATFYRDVPPRQVERWCRQVADRPDFRWTFKLHRRFSHEAGPPAPSDLLAALAAYEPAREQGRLGALLLQFPWSLRPTPANRSRLGDLVAAAGEAGWPLVVEVRHAGWAVSPPFAPVVLDQPALRDCLGPDAALAAALARAGAGPAGRPPAPLYLRLHGRNRAAWFDRRAGRDQRYDYLYRPRERSEWLERLRRLQGRLAASTPVYLITNNHYQGQAVVDALLLQALWSGRRPPVPAELKRSFPAELAGFPELPVRSGDDPGSGGGEAGPADDRGGPAAPGRPRQPTLFGPPRPGAAV